MNEQIKPVAKVVAGAQGGLSTAAISAVVAALLVDDYTTVAIIVVTAFLPVAGSFVAAWIKTDPEMARLRAIVAEMEKQESETQPGDG